MEADDCEAPAFAEQPQRRGETLFQAAEFIVNGDPQRLEGARGRVRA
jgi:hypothetical protein